MVGIDLAEEFMVEMSELHNRRQFPQTERCIDISTYLEKTERNGHMNVQWKKQPCFHMRTAIL